MGLWIGPQTMTIKQGTHEVCQFFFLLLQHVYAICQFNLGQIFVLWA